MKYLASFLIILVFTGFNSHAQVSGEDELGVWYMVFGSHKISEKFTLKTGIEYRTYEPTSNFQMFFVSAGPSFKLSNLFSIGANFGYMYWDRNFLNTGVTNSDEVRFNEHITMTNGFQKLNISQRLRMEHRFIDNYTSYEAQHRLRYKMSLKHPITKTLFVSAFDEIMYNLDGFKFQQNRIYGALGFNLNKNSSFQLGYLKWGFKSKKFDRLQIGFSYKTDWRKETSKS